jgi:hypothetical protein
MTLACIVFPRIRWYGCTPSLDKFSRPNCECIYLEPSALIGHAGVSRGGCEQLTKDADLLYSMTPDLHSLTDLGGSHEETSIFR